MAVIYAYPTAVPELQDLLIGTEMAVQGGEDAPRTRTFTVQSIVDLVEAAVGGATNLTTTQTISNFTINSSTGDDALVPLGNGSLAGATLNNYTTAEKSKLAGIAVGAEVNVNADWNAISGDAQILNKPTIPSINNADYVRNTDDIYTATAKITQIITLDAAQYAAATKLSSTLYIII